MIVAAAKLHYSASEEIGVHDLKKYEESFRRDGYVVVRNLFPKALVEDCLKAIQNFSDFTKAVADKNAVFEEVPAGDVRPLKYFQHIERYVPSFWQLYNSRILAVAEALLQQPTYYTDMGLHNKIPFKGTHTPAHQDNFYWCLDPPDALTCYIPLEPQNASNGGISYLPGSHTQGCLEHAKGKVPAFSSALVKSFPAEEFIKLDLSPGDVVFHHSHIVHGAEANTSPRHRRAVAVKVYGEKAKISPTMLEVYENFRKFNRGEGGN